MRWTGSCTGTWLEGGGEEVEVELEVEEEEFFFSLFVFCVFFSFST